MPDVDPIRPVDWLHAAAVEALPEVREPLATPGAPVGAGIEVGLVTPQLIS